MYNALMSLSRRWHPGHPRDCGIGPQAAGLAACGRAEA